MKVKYSLNVIVYKPEYSNYISKSLMDLVYKIVSSHQL